MFSSFLAQDIPGVVAHMAEEVEWEQFEVPTTAQVCCGCHCKAHAGWMLPMRCARLLCARRHVRIGLA